MHGHTFPRECPHIASAQKRGTCSGLVLEDPNVGIVAGQEFDLAADGQRGERAGVSEVDVGHYWQSDESLLAVEDLFEEIAVHAAGLLEAADEEAAYAGSAGLLEQGGEVAGEDGRVGELIVFDGKNCSVQAWHMRGAL